MLRVPRVLTVQRVLPVLRVPRVLTVQRALPVPPVLPELTGL